MLAYQYLQALPQIAAGASNKIWIVPVELTKALEGIGGALTGLLPGAGPITTEPIPEEPKELLDQALREAQRVAAETQAEVAAGPLGLPAGDRISASDLLGDTAVAERRSERA